jgi:hypothetical protein
LTAFVAKLMCAKTGHVVASFVSGHYHIALRAFPEAKFSFHVASDQFVARVTVYELPASGTMLLFADIALKFD